MHSAILSTFTTPLIAQAIVNPEKFKLAIEIRSLTMLELKFAIYHRAASLSSQAVLAEEQFTGPCSLQTLPAHQLYF